MADMIVRNKKNTHKLLRVDLTPMVDLGFLLITFFIISNSLAKPKAMPINFPADGNTTTAASSKTLNLIICSNKLNYYFGYDSTRMSSCSFNNNELRNLIIKKQIDVEKKFGNKNEILILIKPTSSSNYKTLVQVLDEMLINKVTRYMVVNPSKFEEKI